MNYEELRHRTVKNVVRYLNEFETENPDFPLYESAELLTLVIDQMASTSAQALCREEMKPELVNALLTKRKEYEDQKYIQNVQYLEAEIQLAADDTEFGVNLVLAADEEIKRQEHNLKLAETQKFIFEEQIEAADAAIMIYVRRLKELQNKVIERPY